VVAGGGRFGFPAVTGLGGAAGAAGRGVGGPGGRTGESGCWSGGSGVRLQGSETSFSGQASVAALGSGDTPEGGSRRTSFHCRGTELEGCSGAVPGRPGDVIGGMLGGAGAIWSNGM
jgi:hypothetical protein